jgi:nitroreductase
MMTFLELVKSRISIRQYTSAKVEDEKIAYILECARFAPSAANYQPWQFLVVRNENVKCLLQECYPAKWLAEAPVYIVACADTAQSWKRSLDGKDHADIDIAIAVEHICLAAAEQGLGTCWICNFDARKCSELLNLPATIIPAAIIPVGYTTQSVSRNPNRKPTEEIIQIIE